MTTIAPISRQSHTRAELAAIPNCSGENLTETHYNRCRSLLHHWSLQWVSTSLWKLSQFNLTTAITKHEVTFPISCMWHNSLQLCTQNNQWQQHWQTKHHLNDIVTLRKITTQDCTNHVQHTPAYIEDSVPVLHAQSKAHNKNVRHKRHHCRKPRQYTNQSTTIKPLKITWNVKIRSIDLISWNNRFWFVVTNGPILSHSRMSASTWKHYTVFWPCDGMGREEAPVSSVHNACQQQNSTSVLMWTWTEIPTHKEVVTTGQIQRHIKSRSHIFIELK